MQTNKLDSAQRRNRGPRIVASVKRLFRIRNKNKLCVDKASPGGILSGDFLRFPGAFVS